MPQKLCPNKELPSTCLICKWLLPQAARDEKQIDVDLPVNRDALSVAPVPVHLSKRESKCGKRGHPEKIRFAAHNQRVDVREAEWLRLQTQPRTGALKPSDDTCL
jgi:hypothetical protein